MSLHYSERWWTDEARSVPVTLVPVHRLRQGLNKAGYGKMVIDNVWITFEDRDGKVHLLPNKAVMGDLIDLI